MPTYRVTLACSGVPRASGARVAADIEHEFAVHRPWWRNARCVFVDSKLLLSAENDVDEGGRALMDEFSDCICAYIEHFDGSMTLVEVEKR